MQGRPIIIGIAGPSCAGKTLLAANLTAALRDATLVAVDSYYRDLSALTPDARAAWNFDAPEAVEHELFAAQLAELAGGRPIHKPVYDYTTHTRKAETERVVPMRHVIVEGLFALYWPEPRTLMDLKVFVGAPDDVCLQRRQRRDVAERGRTPESVLTQFRQTVAPMYERYCRPTMAFADLVLDGREKPSLLLQRVMPYLPS